MGLLILLGVFAICVIIGMPVAFALGVAAVSAFFYEGLPLMIAFQRIISGISIFALMAIPFFGRIFKRQKIIEAEIDDVVLTAPDVSHEQFGEQFKEEIKALTDQLTVYVSSNDRALLMSRILNRGRRLGESTVDLDNPDQSEEALKALQMVEPGSSNVTLVDVTPVNRTRNFHNFSLETPEFFDDLFLRLTNDDTPRSRLKYLVRTPEGAEYWVLTRGR